MIDLRLIEQLPNKTSFEKLTSYAEQFYNHIIFQIKTKRPFVTQLFKYSTLDSMLEHYEFYLKHIADALSEVDKYYKEKLKHFIEDFSQEITYKRKTIKPYSRDLFQFDELENLLFLYKQRIVTLLDLLIEMKDKNDKLLKTDLKIVFGDYNDIK